MCFNSTFGTHQSSSGSFHCSKMKPCNCGSVALCTELWHLLCTLTVKQYHSSQLTELKSVKPKVEPLVGLLDAEDETKGSLPLNGSPRPFLLWKGSMTSPLNGLKGSQGLEESDEPVMFTGVVLPEDIKE